MDTQGLERLEPEELTPGAILERRHLDGATLGDLEVAELQLFECMASDCRGGEIRLPGLRSSGTRVLGSSFATLAMPGATLFSDSLEGVRIGALLADGSDVSVYRLLSSRIDVVSLRESRLRRIEIRDCRIGLLDLTGSRVRDVTVTGGSVDELLPSRGDIDGFDVSGTELGRVLDPGALRGATISAPQAEALGPDLARQVGATVRG